MSKHSNEIVYVLWNYSRQDMLCQGCCRIHLREFDTHQGHAGTADAADVAVQCMRRAAGIVVDKPADGAADGAAAGAAVSCLV